MAPVNLVQTPLRGDVDLGRFCESATHVCSIEFYGHGRTHPSSIANLIVLYCYYLVSLDVE